MGMRKLGLHAEIPDNTMNKLHRRMSTACDVKLQLMQTQYFLYLLFKAKALQERDYSIFNSSHSRGPVLVCAGNRATSDQTFLCTCMWKKRQAGGQQRAN